jgi:hypothetical protein
MVTKSMTLVATGAAILAARWIILDLLALPKAQGSDNA